MPFLGGNHRRIASGERTVPLFRKGFQGRLSPPGTKPDAAARPCLRSRD